MNIQEFSFHLKERRMSLRISDKMICMWVNPHDLSALENGRNVGIKSLMMYLDRVGLELFYRRRRPTQDFGYFKYCKDKSVFYSQKDEDVLFETAITDLYGLLSFMNSNGLRVRFNIRGNGGFYKSEKYTHSDTWTVIEGIHNTLRKTIEISNVSIPALAESLHISVLSLNYFLTGVVNHDFKLLEVIAQRIGYTGIFRFKSRPHCRLDIINGNLYALQEGEPNELLKENCGKKIEDVVDVLMKLDFKYAFFAKDENIQVEPLMIEGNVDAEGKLKFDQYEKKELEQLIKWRKISILRNETCDYCHSRGIVVYLYPTVDNREIQICKYCKDKIHPTSNYVHIIYTPTGGKSR